MKYCKKCLQPDTRPGIVFYKDGVCMACKNAEARKRVNWFEREAELIETADWAKEQDAMYDCVIGVSGGKDSTFQAFYARDVMRLNPLLVNAAPDGISDVGKYNLENLVQHGFDMISLRPNPKIERYLSKKAFFVYGNFVKPLEYPLYTSAYLIALKFDIPLVIQGENDADVFGVDKLKKGPDAMSWADVDTVAGGDASIWVDDDVEEEDLRLYQFPDKQEMIDKGMKAIFLEYYVKEWSYYGNTEFSVSKGLRGRENHDPMRHGKINRFSSVDADLKIVNQMIKYLKFGFGACTDEVNFAIREGRMTREDGIFLVSRYDGKCADEYIHSWCEYIGITIQDFWYTVKTYVNPYLFDDTMERKFTVAVDNIPGPKPATEKTEWVQVITPV